MAKVSNFFYRLGDIFGGRGPFSRPNWMIGQKGPVWVDTDKPGEIYYQNPQIKLVYDRFASMYSNMQIVKEVKTAKGWEIQEDDVLQKLLQNPNPTQGQNSWLTERILQKLVYGNQFTYKKVVAPRINKYPRTLRNISPVFIRPYLSGKIFDQVDMEGIVPFYEYRDRAGIFRRFESKEIMWQRIPGLDDPLIGISKMTGYKYPISNSEAAYKYLNIISTNKGAIGMLANESKDKMGSVPLKAEEKKRIQDEHLRRYGIDEEQMHIIITEATLKWYAFGYPTKELLLIEQIKENKLTIIDSLHLNANIFANENSTYENVRMGYVQSYNDAIQPMADLDMQELSTFIGLQEGERLRASYEHIPLMKEHKRQGILSLKSLVETLDIAVERKLMTGQEAVVILRNEFGLS